MFYDRDGVQITMNQWTQLRDHDNSEYWRVARTTIIAPHETNHIVHVSTVWVGLDHRLDEHSDPLPLVFETLIDRPGAADVVERYGSREAAEAGHHRNVIKAASGVTDAVVTDVEG